MVEDDFDYHHTFYSDSEQEKGSYSSTFEYDDHNIEDGYDEGYDEEYDEGYEDDDDFSGVVYERNNKSRHVKKTSSSLFSNNFYKNDKNEDDEEDDPIHRLTPLNPEGIRYIKSEHNPRWFWILPPLDKTTHNINQLDNNKVEVEVDNEEEENEEEENEEEENEEEENEEEENEEDEFLERMVTMMKKRLDPSSSVPSSSFNQVKPKENKPQRKDVSEGCPLPQGTLENTTAATTGQEWNRLCRFGSMCRQSTCVQAHSLESWNPLCQRYQRKNCSKSFEECIYWHGKEIESKKDYLRRMVYQFSNNFFFQKRMYAHHYL